jgi:EAL domain-containing protein (putative c-di-GMP-specific phosphodiesterase class I)
LYYQPKIDRKSGRIIGAEALVRWRHPTLGFMSPASFLPIAAQAGLMSELDDWVLNQAVRQIRSWLSAGLAVPRIAVNISPDRFIDNLLPQRIGACLAQYGVDTHYLELEITEETIIKDIDKTMATLQAISDIGITIAVDDFGTGYSSLSYLARFPIHYLKIDRSFIVDMTLRTNVATIVSSIIALAHALGLGVVAEGVSDTSHLPLLNQFDCEVLQGFLFSQPLPPEAFLNYVVSNNYFAPNYSSLGPQEATAHRVEEVTVT